MEDLSRKKTHENVDEKLQHLDDVIFLVLVLGIWMFLYNICLFMTQCQLFMKTKEFRTMSEILKMQSKRKSIEK